MHEFLSTEQYTTFNYEEFKSTNQISFKCSNHSELYYFTSKILYNFNYKLINTKAGASISNNSEIPCQLNNHLKKKKRNVNLKLQKVVSIPLLNNRYKNFIGISQSQK